MYDVINSNINQWRNQLRQRHVRRIHRLSNQALYQKYLHPVIQVLTLFHILKKLAPTQTASWIVDGADEPAAKVSCVKSTIWARQQICFSQTQMVGVQQKLVLVHFSLLRCSS